MKSIQTVLKKTIRYMYRYFFPMVPIVISFQTAIVLRIMFGEQEFIWYLTIVSMGTLFATLLSAYINQDEIARELSEEISLGVKDLIQKQFGSSVSIDVEKRTITVDRNERKKYN